MVSSSGQFTKALECQTWIYALFVHAKSLQLCLTLCNPWAVARQAPLSMGFSEQEYWSGLPFLPPGDLPDSGIKPETLTLLCWQVGSLSLALPGKLKTFFFNLPRVRTSDWVVCGKFLRIWACLLTQLPLDINYCITKNPNLNCRGRLFELHNWSARG